MPVAKHPTASSAVDPRIRDLQQKIQDETYVNSAIERIALIVSRRLVEDTPRSRNSAEKLY